MRAEVAIGGGNWLDKMDEISIIIGIRLESLKRKEKSQYYGEIRMRQGVVFSIIVLTIFCAPVLAYDWSTNPGDGSPDNPYQISTPEQLMSIGSNADLLDKHFILMSDIVFDPNNNPEHVFDRALIAPDTDDALSFFQGTVFSGVFDGNNHIISNLAINGGFACGLFGKIDNNGGVVADLGLESVSINASSGYTGGLCGWISGSGGGAGGNIADCYVTGTINGVNNVGGLCGYSFRGNITDCYVNGTVSGTSYEAGGLCGTSDDTNITNCHVDVAVIQESSAGGLIGFYNGGLITNCSARGNVTAGSSVGGLVGRCWDGSGTASPPAPDTSGSTIILTEAEPPEGLISSCYSNCNLSGYPGNHLTMGGLIGTNNRRKVLNCYSAGTITAGPEVASLGGLIGKNTGGMIENSYSSTEISGAEGTAFVGGLIGKPEEFQFVNSCFFLDTVGTDNGYGIPLTDEQMKQESSFTGWNFVDVWKINEGSDYPRLQWEITNIQPVADAGADQAVYAFVDGYALVQLDGTGSYDDDGDALTYSWYVDANEIATGAEPNVLFGVGEYEVTLIVNDGIEDSEPDACVVTVVDPFEALVGDIAALVPSEGVANSLLAKVDTAQKKLEDGNEKNDGAAVGSLRALIHAVNAQRGKKIAEDDADSLIAVAEQIISML